MSAPELSAVDWRQVGEAVVMFLVAGAAAFKGAQRVWKKGLADLLRPAITKEVGAAIRNALRAVHAETVEQLRKAMHEELAPLREELDALSERVARLEGAMDVLAKHDRHEDAPQ